MSAGIEKIAKRMALDQANANRAKDGMDPLQELPVDWWEVFGPKWIEEARRRIEESKRASRKE